MLSSGWGAQPPGPHPGEFSPRGGPGGQRWVLSEAEVCGLVELRVDERLRDVGLVVRDDLRREQEGRDDLLAVVVGLLVVDGDLLALDDLVDHLGDLVTQRAGVLSLIHISEPTRLRRISYAV